MKKEYLDIFNNLSGQSITMNLNSRVLIVDGLNNFIRAFSTSPVTNDDGIHVGGISGFLLTLGYAVKQIRPSRIVIVFDGKGGSQRRRKIYPAYKANRKPGSDIKRSQYLQTDEDVSLSMSRQIKRLIDYLNALPVCTIVIDNIEADDTIAYLTKLVKNKNGQSFIMSTDKDFLQLVDDTTYVWSPTKKKLYFKNDVLEEYGISAENFLLYRTITGDKGDNLPKIKGIGASTLIKKVPAISNDEPISLDALFEICKSNLEDKTLSTILDNQKLVETNYVLMQLKDVDISGNAKSRIMNSFDDPIMPFVKNNFMKLFIQDRMSNAIKNLNNWILDVFNPIAAIASKSYSDAIKA